MKIKYSALVSATSGKLNGSVAASNRGGAYLRNKGVTSNPQTVSQQTNRSRFGSISSQFRSLTPSQIAAWNSAAQDFPIIDRFGDTRYLSGLALFVQLNKNLADIGLPAITEPPVKQSFPAIEAVGFNVLVGDTPAEDVVQGTINAEFTGNTFEVVVYATGNISPSINYVKNRVRVVGSEQSSVGSAVTAGVTDEWKDLFGRPILDQKVKGEVALISRISGEKSAVFPFETIVTSA